MAAMYSLNASSPRSSARGAFQLLTLPGLVDPVSRVYSKLVGTPDPRVSAALGGALSRAHSGRAFCGSAPDEVLLLQLEGVLDDLAIFLQRHINIVFSGHAKFVLASGAGVLM